MSRPFIVLNIKIILIMSYFYQPETLEVFTKFEQRFKDRQPALIEHLRGRNGKEPFYIIADNLIRWAKAHKKLNVGTEIKDDYVAQESFIAIAIGLSQMGASPGVIAMEKRWTIDSKEGSVLCDLILKALEIAGIDQTLVF